MSRFLSAFSNRALVVRAFSQKPPAKTEISIKTADPMALNKSTPPDTSVAPATKKVTQPATTAGSGIKLPNYPEKTAPYKVDEYYGHNTFSYYDMELVMDKHRLSQPICDKK